MAARGDRSCGGRASCGSAPVDAGQRGGGQGLTEIETSLARRIGNRPGAGERDLATALIEQGVSVDAARSVVAELGADSGGVDLAGLEAAQLLAAWEEAAPGAGAARVLGKVGFYQLGVTREGLADFVRTVTSEQRRRQLPPVGAGNSAVVVDLPRCGPMLIRRVPNLVPIPGVTGSAHCAVGPLEGPRDHRLAPPTRRAAPTGRPTRDHRRRPELARGDRGRATATEPSRVAGHPRHAVALAPVIMTGTVHRSMELAHLRCPRRVPQHRPLQVTETTDWTMSRSRSCPTQRAS